MKHLILAAGAAMLLCGSIPAQASNSQDSRRVLMYLFEIFHAKDALVQSLQRQTAGEPEVREVSKRALADFDITDLSSLLATPLSEQMPPSDTQQCLAFIGSKDGEALLRASQKGTSGSELPSHIDMLPANERHTAIAFLESNCIKQTNAFLLSQEASTISRNYGKGVACSYAMRTSQEMIDLLISHGECTEYPTQSP